MINSIELQEILERLSRVDNPEPVEYLRETLERIPISVQNSIKDMDSPRDTGSMLELVLKHDLLEITHEDKTSILEKVARHPHAYKEVLKEVLGKVDLLNAPEAKASLLEDIASNDNADKNILEIILEKVETLNDQWYEAYVLGAVTNAKKADRNILERILEKAPSYEDKYKEFILGSVELGAERLIESEQASILKLIAEMRSGKEAAPSGRSWVSRVSLTPDRAGPSLGE